MKLSDLRKMIREEIYRVVKLTESQKNYSPGDVITAWLPGMGIQKYVIISVETAKTTIPSHNTPNIKRGDVIYRAHLKGKSKNKIYFIAQHEIRA